MSMAIEDENDPGGGDMPIWNVYINGVLEDWMQIMRLNRIVCKEDLIVWRFHKKVDNSEEAKAVSDRVPSSSSRRLKIINTSNVTIKEEEEEEEEKIMVIDDDGDISASSHDSTGQSI